MNQPEERAAGSDIGQRIASARREIGLTQEELAERIGVMRWVLDAYESGTANPSRHLDRIAAATGKEALWFLRRDPPREMVALLQRDAAALAKREDELGIASERTEARLRELSEAERHHEMASADLEATEQALKAREAKLELAEQRLRETSEELADRIAALETRERELEASRQRHAEESESLRSQQATLGPREQALTEREQELERRQAELANWTQTANTDLLKQAKALDDRRSTLEREQRRLEEARAEAERRLVRMLEPVRTAAAQLEAQLAERQPEEEAKPSRWRRGPTARARSTVPPKGSAAG